MSIPTKKIAVITGASSGIGAVYADRLARRGYDPILVARRADRLQALAASIETTHGVSARALVADLATEAGVASVEHILSTDAAVGILLNNAGIARLAPVAASPVQHSLSQISRNLTALTRLTHAVLPASTATEVWDNSGVPLSALNPESVMTTDDMVDAALSAFDKGETLTLPSVADAGLIDRYEAARGALFAATQTGKAAPRLLPA